MILQFTDNTWPMIVANWAAGADPGVPNTTYLTYTWGQNQTAVGCALEIPVSHKKFLDYLKANTDDNGICDITSLQSGGGPGGRP